MDPRQILRNYIATHGTQEAASEALDCARITLSKVLAGTRGVGKGMAKRWERRTRGELKFADMIRIDKTKSEGEPRARDRK